MSSSRSAGGTEVVGSEIGGRVARMTDCERGSESAGMRRWRTTGEGTHLCDLDVAREEAPLDVGAVAQVGRVGRLGREREDALHELLRLFWAVEEELDDGRQGLELDLDGLVGVRVEERADEIGRVADLVGVLAEDPDKRRLGLGLVELVERRAQGRDDALVAMRVPAEDVLRASGCV